MVREGGHDAGPGAGHRHDHGSRLAGATEPAGQTGAGLRRRHRGSRRKTAGKHPGRHRRRPVGDERWDGDCPQMNGFIEDIARDLRHAWRLLTRTRGFTVTAIAVLAICIGANSAVFSVINSLLLRPLPYPDADRLVQVVNTHDPTHQIYTLDTSIPKYIAWRQSVRIFSDLAAYQAADPGVNLVGGGPPEHLSSLHVSYQYFGVFGARALHGRVFKYSEDQPQGPHVVVLSHGFWRRRFAGNPRVVGQTLPLAGAAYEIVGVLSGDFRPDPAVDVYLPLRANEF